MNILKPTSSNPLLVLCVTLALVVAIVAQQLYVRSLHQGVYLQNRNYAVYLGMQELYQTRKASIVMLGDSHSTWAHWDEMFGRCDIINRGIPNDIS